MEDKNLLQKFEKLFNLYENNRELKLNFTEPFIVRIRQQSYTQFSKDFYKPFDSMYTNAMKEAMSRLVKNRSIGGCTLGYLTHNEINLIYTGCNPTDYKQLLSSMAISQLVSWISSMMTSYFNEALLKQIDIQEKENENRHEEGKVDINIYKNALFKAEFKVNAFSIPSKCIYDYLYLKSWSCVRTSTALAALPITSVEEREGKKATELEKVLKDRGTDVSHIHWNYRYGVLCAKVRKDNKSSTEFIYLDRPLSVGGTNKISKNKKDILHLLNGHNLGNVKQLNIL